MDPEDIAVVVHEAIRGMQLVQGDPCPSDPWQVASHEAQGLCIAGVLRAQRPGVTPAWLHDLWVADKVRLGWNRGPVKDGVRKTHPNLVPYHQLPPGQQAKDRLFIAIVRALS